MATFDTFVSFRQTLIDFHALWSVSEQTEFNLFDSFDWAGVAYDDYLLLRDGTTGNELVFLGSGLTYDAGTDTLSGTLLGVGYGDGSRIIWGLTDISIAADIVYAAFKSPDTVDDRTLFDSALAGADTVLLSDFDDVIATGGGNDSIDGFFGNDSIRGDGGDDTLFGNGGNDTLWGDEGNDSLDGSDGIDLIRGGTEDDILRGGIGNDSLFGDEGGDDLYGGDGRDAIFGGSGNDFLSGEEGNDSLDGGEGDDVLFGDAGNDTLTGGAGTDWASYLHVTGPVTVSLGPRTAQVTGGAGRDVLVGIENLEGSEFDDLLSGSAGANIIVGDLGNDTILAGQGADEVYGGEGNDLFVYASTADIAGDLVSGNEGFDELRYTGTSGTVVIGADIYVERVVIGTGTALAPQITGAGAVNIDASQGGFALELQGNAGANLIVGTDFDDTLRGNFGNDTLIGGTGNDRLVGGSGTDVASYADATAGLLLSLAVGSAQFTAEFGSDIFNLIEGLEGGSGNDSFAGAETDDVLIGNGGNDLLAGDEGNDILTGGEGDDTLVGGAGNDVLTGGNGNDTAVYLGAAAGVVVNLAQTTAQKTVGAGTDLLTGIENVVGSALGDVLTGSTLANAMDGGTGNDTLTGGAGADTLIGGEDDDLFLLASVADLAAGETVAGGNGTDELRYIGTTAAAVPLILGAGVTVERIVIGTGTGAVALSSGKAALSIDASAMTGAVTMIGNAGANRLIGTDHGDTIDGGGGNDTLTGGLGDDSLTGGAGTDIASYAGATEDLTISLGLGSQVIGLHGTDSFAGIEGVEGGSGNDILTGTLGNDILIGGAGDDTLIGGAGNDILTGGDGAADWADYTDAGGTVQVSLALTTAQITGGAGTDVLNGVEHLAGSSFADALTGSALANRIEGGIGNDTILGGLGIDTLIGGEDDDLFLLTAATEHGLGESITGGAGTDELRYVGTTPAQVVLGAGVSVERIVIGTGTAATAVSNGIATIGIDAGNMIDAVTMIGNAGANRLVGTGLGDGIDGGAGRDTLIGGGGDDTLTGGLGVDSLTGGAGADVFVFNFAGGPSNADTLADFDAAQDMIHLKASIFTALGGAGALSADAFRLGAAAADADDRILYDGATGGLFYDADGNGARAAVRLATLENLAALTQDDFLIY